MAFRLNRSVIRGEIDNRTPGRVCGKLWLVGRDAPVRLALAGNCQADLAGCLLTFHNPEPAHEDYGELTALQRGEAGVMTASRKVRINDLAQHKSGRYHLDGPPTYDNAIYLEWYSESNGRVVIEAVGFQLSLSDHEWNLSTTKHQPPPRPDASGRALDEFAWEAFMRKSDEIAERYAQAVHRYRQHPDRERLIANEMGWSDEEVEEDDFITQFGMEGPGSDAFCPLIPNPETEGLDWVHSAEGEVHHPLTLRSQSFAMRLWHYCCAPARGEAAEDEDLQELVNAVDYFSAKIAGALDSMAFETSPDFGYMIASLKRALMILHKAIASLSHVERKGLLPEAIDGFRTELFDLRQDVITLMQDFRQHQ